MTSPAAAFLEELSQGMWLDDPDGADLPDDVQIRHFDKLLTWFQLLADEGVPPYRTAVNSLDDGVWEYKLGAKRVSFFDTPGDGSFAPKGRLTDPALTTNDDEYWWFPTFDEFIRLGHPFPKMGQKTTPHDIRMTLLVREEDLAHDRE